MLKKILPTKYTLKLLISFIALILLSATLLHAFYYDISIVHALVIHPLFIVGILLLLLISEQHSKNKSQKK